MGYGAAGDMTSSKMAAIFVFSKNWNFSKKKVEMLRSLRVILDSLPSAKV